MHGFALDKSGRRFSYAFKYDLEAVNATRPREMQQGIQPADGHAEVSDLHQEVVRTGSVLQWGQSDLGFPDGGVSRHGSERPILDEATQRGQVRVGPHVVQVEEGAWIVWKKNQDLTLQERKAIP